MLMMAPAARTRQKSKPAARSALAENLLTSTGARLTRARIQVLATLLTAGEALTHHEVERRLKRGHDIDRVTLYRVLEWLTEKGLAHKFAGEDRVWRFSVAGHEHRHGGGHAHFECSECGKVICLDQARLKSVLLPAGYRRREVEVTIKGSCAECAG
jgi:Fur family ferric uptake transcriptional regulator